MFRLLWICQTKVFVTAYLLYLSSVRTTVSSSSTNPFGAPKNQTCEHYVEFLPANKSNQTTVGGDNSSGSQNYEYVDSSRQCDAEIGSEWLTYRQCAESEISLALYTETLLPIGNFKPYIRLNMSATLLEPASEVWFVYTCLQAPDGEDEYCHNRDIQLARYGANVLPCRGVRLDNRTKPASFRVDILCFKIFGLSQYRIDVVVRRGEAAGESSVGHCRATLFASMPSDSRYDPRIEQFYAPSLLPPSANDSSSSPSTLYTDWSPLVFVAVHPADGVWVRFEEPPPMARVLQVDFALYRQQSMADPNEAVQFVRDEVVRLPSSGFKWIDLEAGTYIIYSYIKRAHCRLICNSSDAAVSPSRAAKRSATACVACPHTMLNFTLPHDKFTAEWQRTKTLIGATKIGAIALLTLLLMVGISLVSVIVYLRVVRPRRALRRPPQNFELVARPHVLVLYSDDCGEHAECVARLADFLVASASAHVHLDQWDLMRDPSVRATNWLVERLASVDFVLVVFSAGSRRVMEGERMKECRPYPDLFNPALRIVISKITSIVSGSSALGPASDHLQSHQRQNGSARLANGNSLSTPSAQSAVKEALKKFIVLRFDYSPPDTIAEFFPLMGCACYQVPDELPRLVAHLHGVETSANSLLEFSADRTQLDEAIQEFLRFRQENPNYLEERFVTHLPNSMGIDQLTGLDLANPDLPEQGVRTDEEMLRLMEKYELVEAPASDHEDDEPQQPDGGRRLQETNDTGIVVDRSEARSERQIAEKYPLISLDAISSSSDDDDAG